MDYKQIAKEAGTDLITVRRVLRMYASLLGKVMHQLRAETVMSSYGKFILIHQSFFQWQQKKSRKLKRKQQRQEQEQLRQKKAKAGLPLVPPNKW